MAQSDNGAETGMQGGDANMTSKPISVGRNLISEEPLSGIAYDFGQWVEHVYIDSISADGDGAVAGDGSER